MNGKAWALIVAAGRGERFGGGVNKVYMPLAGYPVLAHSLRSMEKSGVFGGIVLVHASGERDWAEKCAVECGLPVRLVEGGERRQDSVAKGLRAIPDDADVIAVHDGARPLAPPELFARCVASAREYGSGVAAGYVTDTIKVVGEDSTVIETPQRRTLRAAKTPQCFRAQLLREAYQRAEEMGWDVTDDAAVAELSGNPVRLVECGEENIKITGPGDLRIAEAMMGMMGIPRVGMGYDAHRLAQGRRLILCGVEIPHEKGLDGHSDADVAAHAIADALLGAAGLGDIGMLFPDSDPKYKDADSMRLLAQVISFLREQGFAPHNIDVTIVAQRPKLSAYRDEMAENAARAAGLERASVGVKMTTTERMGFVGREEGIAAYAVATVIETSRV